MTITPQARAAAECIVAPMRAEVGLVAPDDPDEAEAIRITADRIQAKLDADQPLDSVDLYVGMNRKAKS